MRPRQHQGNVECTSGLIEQAVYEATGRAAS